MFINLPDELIYKIVNKLESIEIYYLTLTSKQLNKMNFQSILTALLFKTYFDLDRNELIEMREYGYTLGNYLSDLNEVNSYNMPDYKNKKSIYLEEKLCIDLMLNKKIYLKKYLMNVKIHSVYRIPFMAYRLLRIQKSPILALIY